MNEVGSGWTCLSTTCSLSNAFYLLGNGAGRASERTTLREHRHGHRTALKCGRQACKRNLECFLHSFNAAWQDAKTVGVVILQGAGRALAVTRVSFVWFWGFAADESERSNPSYLTSQNIASLSSSGSCGLNYLANNCYFEPWFFIRDPTGEPKHKWKETAPNGAAYLLRYIRRALQLYFGNGCSFKLGTLAVRRTIHC
jgi:hypothetical protein